MVGLVAVRGRGMARRLPILVGAGLAYGLYLVLANGLGLAFVAGEVALIMWARGCGYMPLALTA